VSSLRIEFDDQQTESSCVDCGVPYRSVIGVVYEDEDPLAIYRADIFEQFHREGGPRVLLSIALGEWEDGSGRTDRCSAAIEAWPDGDRVQMAISNRAAGPWDELEVVGWQMTAGEPAESPLRDAFFRLADHIARDDRRLRRALSSATAL